MDDTTLENFSVKLNGQLTARNSASGSYWESEKVKLGRNVGPDRPPETGWNQGGFGDEKNFRIEDTHIFSPNLYLTGLYTEVNGGFNLIPDSGIGCRTAACARGSDRVARLDLETGIWNETFSYYETLRPQEAIRADVSAFTDGGALSHEIVFGFGYRETPVSAISGWPGDQRVIDRPGPIDGVALYRQSDADYAMNYTDFYIGDTILVGNLAFQAGLRYDVQEGFTRDGSTGANRVIPDVLTEVRYDSTPSGEVEWESVSPRIGVTWTLGKDHRLLLRAAYNRYVDQLGSEVVGAPSPLYTYQYLYFEFEDRNGNQRAETEEIIFDGGPFGNGILDWYNIDPTSPGRALPFDRYDPDIEPPTTDELILGFEYELLPEFVVGMNYASRRYGDQIWFRPEKGRGSGDYYTSDDYESAGEVTTTLPTGETTTVTYYDLREGIPVPVNFVVTNRPDYEQKYDGVELNLVKRLSNGWMARGHLSFNDWEQSVGPNGFIDPTPYRTSYGCYSCDGSVVVQGSGIASGAKGEVFINSGWSFDLTGLYQIPFIDVNVGASVIGREGYPIPYVHRVSTSTGRKYVLVDGVEPDRLDDIYQLDLRLSKEFALPDGFDLSVSVDAFNITNEQAILQRHTELARNGTMLRTGSQIKELQSPRLFRLGARLTF